MQEAHRRFQAFRKDENQRIARTKRQKCWWKGVGRQAVWRKGIREKQHGTETG